MGLLPEGVRLQALVSRVKTSESDMFSLLAGAGSDTIGDLWVNSPSDSTPSIRSKADFGQVRFRELWQETLENLAEPSIPGVQEKLSPSMISFPLKATSSRKAYILKLNPPHRARLVENEAFFMSCAKSCGLNVARIHPPSIDGAWPASHWTVACGSA